MPHKTMVHTSLVSMTMPPWDLSTFLKGLVSEGVAHLNQGAQFGGFVSGMATGKGAAIDGDGNAEVESIKVRSVHAGA